MRRLVNRTTLALLVSCASLVAAIATAQTGRPAQSASSADAAIKNPVPATPQSIAAGQATFAKYCRFCHGADAKGDGPMAPEGTHPSSLVDEKWERGSTDGEIFAVVRDGTAPKFDMKGYKGKLTDQDMWNIVNYLRSIGPETKSR